jgi:small subunit ribosomal protein S20
LIPQEVVNLANHKSALKRARQNELRRLRNKGYKTRAKSAVKDVRDALKANNRAEAAAGLARAKSILQKTASKGVIHRNNAARKISRLNRQANRLPAS